MEPIARHAPWDPCSSGQTGSHLGDIEHIPVAVWANPAEPGFCPAAAPMPGSPIAAPPPTSTGPILWRNNVSDGAFRQSAQQPVAPKSDGDAVD
jgi:hypothetical protein